MEKFLLEMEMEKDMNMEHGWNNYVIYNLPCISFYFCLLEPFVASWILLEPSGAFWSFWNGYGKIM